MDAAPDSSAVAEYYNDARVSKFYELCWGGSDIHVGMYVTGKETVSAASAAMAQHLIQIAGIRAGDRVVDIACGFGGTLRALASIGCMVRGIDISRRCIERAHEAIIASGHDKVIDISEGDFHEIECESDAWDAVMCQEAIIHSKDRPRVFAEVFRVLCPGGVFAFSDILTSDGADIAMVEAAFARLGASAGATAKNYREMAQGAGFKIAHEELRLADIRNHYDKLAESLTALSTDIGSDELTNLSRSIGRWQASIAGGHITWGCFVARKPKPVSASNLEHRT